MARPLCWGADTPYAVNHLAQTVITAMQKKIKITHVAARHDVKHADSDHTKVRKFFGQRDSVSRAEGVGRMAQWVRKAGVWTSKEFENIGICKNLPSSRVKVSHG